MAALEGLLFYESGKRGRALLVAAKRLAAKPAAFERRQ
jgi:hypothetical protein